MKMKFLGWLIAVVTVATMTGCVGTVDGRSRAAVPFSKDLIESRYERTVTQIFEAAKEVLKFNGTLTSENLVNNTLEAKVDTRVVWIAVDEVEPKVSRIRTQVRRKGGRGDVDLAAEIDKQIALRLR